MTPAADLIVQRPEGLYCPAGDFHIDPHRPVPRVVLTHAHADHARRGHGAYLATAVSAPVLRARLGDIRLQGLDYGEAVTLGGVRVSLHPAGHVLGSAQVRLEHRGQVWVASGDYFLSADDADRNPTCSAFEPLRCDCFVTESTFGLPVYRWPPQRRVLAEINAWWADNAAQGCTSVLQGYSFGKAQRLLAGLEPSIGPIVAHPAVAAMNEACRRAGVALPRTRTLQDMGEATDLGRALLLVPPGLKDEAWRQAAEGGRKAFASGWMQLRRERQRPGLDRGFVLSDHADWPGLQRAIVATGAARVIVTHGQEAAMVRWLSQRGLQAGRFGEPRSGIGAGAPDSAAVDAGQAP